MESKLMGESFQKVLIFKNKVQFIPKITKVGEVVDGELYDRKEESSTISEVHDAHLTDAHLLEPKVIPDFVWRQGTIYDVQNEELLMTLFSYLPEDTYLVDQIPPVNSTDEVNQVLATKVEETDLNDNKKVQCPY